ncbi:MAG: hypothetical protein C0171_03660 [Caldisphaera sp.]|nr:MAG: hypothetical protein C0171_03660 [Caldisphaera sp.]
MEDKKYLFKCINCGHETSEYCIKCPVCGGKMQIVYNNLTWKIENKIPSMWRYKNMLPLSKRLVSFGEGLTPLKRINGILCKLETRNPSGSYADRSSSAILSNLEYNSFKLNYIEDFALSFSYYARKIGKNVDVKVDPEMVDPQELILLSRLGVKISFKSNKDVLLKEITYDNPYTIEGLKTISYEIYEKSLKEYKIFVPAQSGTLVYAIGKGLYELKNMRKDFPEFELIAVKLKRTEIPEIINSSNYKIKIMSVSSEEAMESMIKLSKKGLNVKPLASVSYALAMIEGNGIAIITGKGKNSLNLTMKDTDLSKDIINLLSDGNKRTAYEIWLQLGKYSLKGVYRSLESLSKHGRICENFEMKGERKIKFYGIC